MTDRELEQNLTIRFMMTQIEVLAERCFQDGHKEWLEKCDAYQAGKRALEDKP